MIGIAQGRAILDVRSAEAEDAETRIVFRVDLSPERAQVQIDIIDLLADLYDRAKTVRTQTHYGTDPLGEWFRVEGNRGVPLRDLRALTSRTITRDGVVWTTLVIRGDRQHVLITDTLDRRSLSVLAARSPLAALAEPAQRAAA